jgi:hypothetical protein
LSFFIVVWNLIGGDVNNRLCPEDENFQRVNNNPIEIADAIAIMIDRTGITQQDAAKNTTKGRPANQFD